MSKLSAIIIRVNAIIKYGEVNEKLHQKRKKNRLQNK